MLRAVILNVIEQELDVTAQDVRDAAFDGYPDAVIPKLDGNIPVTLIN